MVFSQSLSGALPPPPKLVGSRGLVCCTSLGVVTCSICTVDCACDSARTLLGRYNGSSNACTSETLTGALWSAVDVRTNGRGTRSKASCILTVWRWCSICATIIAHRYIPRSVIVNRALSGLPGGGSPWMGEIHVCLQLGYGMSFSPPLVCRLLPCCWMCNATVWQCCPKTSSAMKIVLATCRRCATILRHRLL